MSIIAAKFPGICSVCQERFAAGTRIEWTKGRPARHEQCTPVAVPEGAIHIHAGSGYGGHAWQAGQVIVNPNKPRCPVCRTLVDPAQPICPEHADLAAKYEMTPDLQPAYLYVLRADQRYYRE